MTASLTGPAVLEVILLNQKSDQSTRPVKTDQWLIIILRPRLELPSVRPTLGTCTSSLRPPKYSR